jgi:hypothetical protein
MGTSSSKDVGAVRAVSGAVAGATLAFGMYSLWRRSTTSLRSPSAAASTSRAADGVVKLPVRHFDPAPKGSSASCGAAFWLRFQQLASPDL